MIEELLKRPPIREFLNKYPSERWKKLITDVFEIGVLNLSNSFHTLEFSEREFNAILNDLRYYNNRSAPPTPYSNPAPPKYYPSNPPKPTTMTHSNYYYDRTNEQRIFNCTRKHKKYTPAKGEVFVTNDDEIERKFGNKTHFFDRNAEYRIMENKNNYDLRGRVGEIGPSQSTIAGIQQSKAEYAMKIRKEQEEQAELDQVSDGEDDKEDGEDVQDQEEIDGEEQVEGEGDEQMEGEGEDQGEA